MRTDRAMVVQSPPPCTGPAPLLRRPVSSPLIAILISKKASDYFLPR